MVSLSFRTPFHTATALLFTVILLVLGAYAFVIDTDDHQYKPKKGQPCEGIPITVDYPFHGGMLQPHACKPQCQDGTQRYVLYTNGKATQCQKPPGCLDWGEDNGVTCEPPA